MVRMRSPVQTRFAAPFLFLQQGLLTFLMKYDIIVRYMSPKGVRIWTEH